MSKQDSIYAQLKEMHGNLGYSDEEWIEAALDQIARNACLDIGAAPNSPIQKAMMKLTREVWSLAETLLQKKAK